MIKTFNHPGGNIWFVVHLNDAGEIVALEDHDNYSGDHVRLQDNPGYQFIKMATDRGVDRKTIGEWVAELSTAKAGFNSPQVTVNDPKFDGNWGDGMGYSNTSRRYNFILDTDSYKLSHFLGYPTDAQYVYSYAESRGGVYDATVFFGLQKFLKELAAVRITLDDILEARDFAEVHGEPFNLDGWLRIFYDHGGKIPVRIKAVPEGTVVPTRNVLVTVENTDPTMPWLTSYIETALLRATWYPTTVATRIHGMKQRMLPYFETTSDNPNLDFSLVDFSARGVSSRETAEIGGMAHLASFSTSDNIPAILAARRFYDEPMAAFSVPATEHSVTTSWGEASEEGSIEHLIENMMPEGGILSVVADTWNVFEFVVKAAKFQDLIRAKGGTLVIRPDSGEMRDVLPKVLMLAREHFGSTKNAKGFDVLNDVKILQGDGINEHTVMEPYAIAQELGISADSIIVGSGGGLMQANIDRDTCKFAFKASNVTRGGIDMPIAKNPITDPGKRSKKGRLFLLEENGMYHTSDDLPAHEADVLRTVYENGQLFNVESLSTIRQRLAKQ